MEVDKNNAHAQTGHTVKAVVKYSSSISQFTHIKSMYSI